ncbi:MAG: DUF3343 domain-containing protein [Clostridiaceae bacterium]|nr:DUF3343 domain-containing protein [Clostridiaceae bacterium]MBW4859815.1 DUF3343 domain-containing protein [Clostridiaceae bacterium]MBW4869755.1 DUF3343 domain-containing protein [Clostridiaceae bacterium]
MSKEKYYICQLASKNYAIQVMYILENLGYTRFKLISTPSQIKRGCNYSIKFKDIEDLKIIIKEVNKLNIEIKEVYSVERINGKRIAKKLRYFI